MGHTRRTNGGTRRTAGITGIVALGLAASVLAAPALPAPDGVHAATQRATATPIPAAGGMGSMPGMGGAGAMDGGMDMGNDMIMTPITGSPTAADHARVDAVLAATRAATARYQDVPLALAAGYTHSTPFFPTAHYSNYLYAGVAAVGTFDPARPTSLLYVKIAWKPSLAGVMYTAPAADTPAQLAHLLPSTLVSWHQHLNVCYLGQAVQVGVAPDACTTRGGRWAPKSQWMLHAWLYLANPDGTFAIKNPAAPWPWQRSK